MKRLLPRLGLLAVIVLPPAVSWSAEVTVVDGDTIIYNGRQAELWGIITPSRTETCMTSTGETWNCGEQAFNQLGKLVADGSFACEEREERFLLCRAGGLDVGRLLVKEGLARARQDYRDVEARAREAKVGLWQ